MDTIEDVKKNIETIRDRIMKSQKLWIRIKDINGTTKVVSIEEFAEEWNGIENLDSLKAEYGFAYITAHQNSIQNLEHNLEKLMLLIGELMLIMQFKKQKSPPKPPAEEGKVETGEGGVVLASRSIDSGDVVELDDFDDAAFAQVNGEIHGLF